MNKLKKIVNKISSLKSVFTPADKYNELIDNHNELITVVEELSNNSGGGGTTDLFANTNPYQFLKVNATNDGLESQDLFLNTVGSKLVKTSANNMGFEYFDLFANTTASQFVKINSSNTGLESINLFANTKANYALAANADNNAVERSKFYYKEDAELNASILIGLQSNPWTTASTGPQFTVPKSIIIGSDGGNHTVSTNTLSGIIALNSPQVRQSNIVSIGNYYHKVFITNGNQIRRKYFYILPDSAASPEYSLLSLIMGGYINGSDSAKTLTVTLNNIDTELREYFINISLGNDKWMHTEMDFIVDNTMSTSANHVTVAVSGDDISVNGTDNLVVNAGTIGKFTAVIHSTPGNAYQKVKICRVF